MQGLGGAGVRQIHQGGWERLLTGSETQGELKSEVSMQSQC